MHPHLLSPKSPVKGRWGIWAKFKYERASLKTPHLGQTETFSKWLERSYFYFWAGAPPAGAGIAGAITSIFTVSLLLLIIPATDPIGLYIESN